MIQHVHTKFTKFSTRVCVHTKLYPHSTKSWSHAWLMPRPPVNHSKIIDGCYSCASVYTLKYSCSQLTRIHGITQTFKFYCT